MLIAFLYVHSIKSLCYENLVEILKTLFDKCQKEICRPQFSQKRFLSVVLFDLHCSLKPYPAEVNIPGNVQNHQKSEIIRHMCKLGTADEQQCVAS